MTFCNYGVWMKLSEEKFAPVPLNSVSANVSIVDLVANVEIVQSFFNGENHAIEAVYKFPLIQGMYLLPNSYKFVSTYAFLLFYR